MKMNRIISLFLSIVLALTVLPVQEVGCLLAGNQIQEELPHNMSTEDAAKNLDVAVKGFLPPSSYNLLLDIDSRAAGLYIHLSESIPTNHSTDIVSPPPDVA
jgi:hypothetical protein